MRTATAQDILNFNEMKEYLEYGIVPNNIIERMEITLEFDTGNFGSKTAPHPSENYPLIFLFSETEMKEYIANGILPADFNQRLKQILENDHCSNCSGVQCMDCVLRYIHENCEKDCPGCCEKP